MKSSVLLAVDLLMVEPPYLVYKIQRTRGLEGTIWRSRQDICVICDDSQEFSNCIASDDFAGANSSPSDFNFYTKRGRK